MALIDTSGAEINLKAAVSIGVNLSFEVKDSGVARDLTGILIYAALKDDCDPDNPDYGDESDPTNVDLISMTVSDAANGIFDFVIASTHFVNREGGRMSYECWQDDSGTILPIAHGEIELLGAG